MTLLFSVFVRGVGCLVYADVEPETELLGFFPKRPNKFVVFGMHRPRELGYIDRRCYTISSGILSDSHSEVNEQQDIQISGLG